MALDIALTQLSKIAELKPAVGKSHGRQLWHYEAGTDAIAAVVAAGYFNLARGVLKPGDRINVVCNTDADYRPLKVLTVPAVGNVTTAALTTGA